MMNYAYNQDFLSGGWRLFVPGRARPRGKRLGGIAPGPHKAACPRGHGLSPNGLWCLPPANSHVSRISPPVRKRYPAAGRPTAWFQPASRWPSHCLPAVLNAFPKDRARGDRGRVTRRHAGASRRPALRRGAHAPMQRIATDRGGRKSSYGVRQRRGKTENLQDQLQRCRADSADHHRTGRVIQPPLKHLALPRAHLPSYLFAGYGAGATGSLRAQVTAAAGEPAGSRNAPGTVRA
jgi:hypothetical protein